jgi:hypothetical protein
MKHVLEWDSGDPGIEFDQQDLMTTIGQIMMTFKGIEMLTIKFTDGRKFDINRTGQDGNAPITPDAVPGFYL